MIPRIEILKQKKLIGKKSTMGFIKYTVSELWKNFLPRRQEISNNVTDDLISMTIYSHNHFVNFNPSHEFEKWAAIEVSNFNNSPTNMSVFTLRGGLYAVFDYKGLNTDTSIFEYIFETWLPNSNYLLDDRPHFEILGEKYKNNDPNSEEEIWIPIKPK